MKYYVFILIIIAGYMLGNAADLFIVVDEDDPQVETLLTTVMSNTTGDLICLKTISGDLLVVSSNSNMWGTLTVTGNVMLKNNLSILSDKRLYLNDDENSYAEFSSTGNHVTWVVSGTEIVRFENP